MPAQSSGSPKTALLWVIETMVQWAMRRIALLLLSLESLVLQYLLPTVRQLQMNNWGWLITLQHEAPPMSPTGFPTAYYLRPARWKGRRRWAEKAYIKKGNVRETIAYEKDPKNAAQGKCGWYPLAQPRLMCQT